VRVGYYAYNLETLVTKMPHFLSHPPALIHSMTPSPLKSATVLLYRIVPALLILGSTPAFALPLPLDGCSATGSVVALQCGPTEIEMRGGTGTSSLEVTDITATSVSVRIDPSVTTGPFVQNLNITGNTTLERNDYPAVFLNTNVDGWSANVNIGSGVTLRSAGLFGAVWVRSESANTAFRNDIYIDSAATVEASGSAVDGITATSNNGMVTLINRGTVTSAAARGLYADGGNTAQPGTVLIRNEGTVESYQASARAINYAGTSRIENTGNVHSKTLQGLIAWSNDGGAEIVNSGTVLADNYNALMAEGTGGDTLAYNSGTITANRLSALADPQYAAMSVVSDGNGAVTATNTSTGVLNAAMDTGIKATSEQGAVTVSNSGSVNALEGIHAESLSGQITITNLGSISGGSAGTAARTGIYASNDQGAISVSNSGSVNALQGIQVGSAGGQVDISNLGTITASNTGPVGVNVVAAARGSLINSGTISSAGDAVRVADGVGYSVKNQAGGVLSGGLALGSMANLSNAGTLVLKQGADLGNPGATGSALSGRIGGNFTQAAGGTMYIAAASNVSYSTLTVGGSASLGGTLDVDVKSGFSGGDLNGVVAATGGATDAGLVVNDNSLRYAFSAVFGSNGMDLVTRDTGVSSVQGAVASRAPGAAGAAAVFDSLFARGTSSPELQRTLNTLMDSQSADQMNAIVQQTLPLLTGNSLSLTSGTLSTVNSVVQSRIDTTRGMASGDGFISDRHAWIKPFGTHTYQHDHDGVTGYSADSGGLVVGVDGSVKPGTNLGMAFAYAHTNVSSNSSGPRQKSDIDSYQLIAYGSQALDGRSDLFFQVDGGQLRNKGKRQIDFMGLSADSRYDGKTAHAGVGVDRRYALSDRTVIAPTLSLDYTWIKDDSYVEEGAGGLDLQVKSRSTDSLVLGLGGKVTHTLTDRFAASANLGAGYDFYNRDARITAAYAGASDAAFVTYGTSQSPWVLRAGAGLTYTTPGGI